MIRVVTGRLFEIGNVGVDHVGEQVEVEVVLRSQSQQFVNKKNESSSKKDM
jgi:hypothetical protein